MELNVKEILVHIRKHLLFSLKSTYIFTCRHPFVASFAFSLFFLYSCYPSLFAFLVSSFPVLFCTALLLGILLSYGEPNIPEIEEDDNINGEVSSLKIGNSVDDFFVKKDESFTLEDLVDSRIGTEERISKASDLYGEREREFDFFAVSSSAEEQNNIVENLEFLMKEQSESYIRTSEVADTEGIEGLMVKIKRPELDDWLESSLGSPWQPINMPDASADSESDRAESSSSDASMTDILPMLDELSPLLDSETPHHAPKSADNSDSELSQHHDSDEESAEKEDECKTKEKDESDNVVTWTADDLQNVMDLGSSDLERNRRLEGLIARRRARKNQIIIYEKDLIDLHSNSTTMGELFHFHPQIPSIFAPRVNPFDLPHDLDEPTGLPPIPGSAPSVLLRQQNPFNLPCNSELEFGFPSQRDHLFRRHESFASHSALTSNLMHEKLGSSRLNPYLVVEKMDSEDSDYVDFHDQLNGRSDSKSISVPASDTVSSAIGPEDQKVPTEQESQEVIALSVPFHHTKPTEQYSQSYEDDLDDSQAELGDDGRSVDPNASAVTEETYQVIDAYGIVEKAIEEIHLGQNHEVVEEKHDDFILCSSSETAEKSLDINLNEVVETQELTTSVSKSSSESIKSSGASSSHLIRITEGADNNQAAEAIYDSSPSGSGNFLANVSVPDDNLLSSDRGDLHSVSTVESLAQEDAMEVVSNAKVLNESVTSEVTQFKEVHESTFHDSSSKNGETMTLSSYINLLDENIAASMGLSETGEEDLDENSSPRLDEDFGDLATSLETVHSSSLSSAETDNEPMFAFSAGFPSTEVEEKHQSMEEFEIQMSFGTYPEESRISNLELESILEENSEDLKVEEHVSCLQTNTTFASSGLQILEEQEVVLHDQSCEEAQYEGNEGEPSMTSNLVSVKDDVFNESVIGKLVDTMEFSNQNHLKSEPEFTSIDVISDSQNNIINEFQINQDVFSKTLNDFHSEHGDVDDDVGEIQVIDEHLLSELDAVGDFQVQELKFQESHHMESQSDSQFIYSGEDSELRSETSPNKAISANLINPYEVDLILNTEKPEDSGYWSLAMAPIEDLTVYNPKLNVLDAGCSEQLGSILKQEQPGELAEPTFSEKVTDKFVTESSYVGLGSFDMVDQEIEAALQEAVLLTLTGRNAEDISSALIAGRRDFNVSLSRHFDLQHSDECGYESTVIRSSEIKADHVESVMPSSSGLISYPLAISEVETSLHELDISGRNFEIEETDSGLLVLEAKSVEDIHSAFKHVTESLINESISPPINPEPVINHPVDPVDTVVEAISPDVEEASDLLVLEAKSAEDINSAFKQAAEEGLSKSTFHFSDSEKMKKRPDFEAMEPSSPDDENSSEMFALEARSAEDIQLAFKQAAEEVSDRPTSPLIDSEASKTNQDHEVAEVMYPETHNNTELLVPEGNSSDDIESASEQADEDLDKQISLETQIDQELFVLDAKYVENVVSIFKSSSEGGLPRSTLLEIDPNHDVVKDGSLQASTDSEQLVLEAESVEERSSTLKQVTEGLFDTPSSSIDPDAAGTYEVANMISLGVENDSEMPSLETKSFEDQNSICKQDIEADLVLPDLPEFGNFQPDHNAIEVSSLNAIDKSEPFNLQSQSFEGTPLAFREAATDSFGQPTAAADHGHNPGEEVLDLNKLPDSGNISDLPVIQAKSPENLNLSFREATENCLSKSESEADTEHDSVGESFLAADKHSDIIVLEEKSTANSQSPCSEFDEGVHHGSSSLPGDLYPMEIHPSHEVENNESNSEMPVVEAKSVEDINVAFKQAFDVAASPLLVESRSFDIDSESSSLVLEPRSVELTDSSLTKVHQEGSNLSTVYTDSPPLQANSDDDDSKLLVLEEKPSEDIDSTSEQVILQYDSKEIETIPQPVSVELTDSSLTKEYEEGSNLSTVSTDSLPLQANSDDDDDDSKLLVLEEKPSEDIDSTSEQVTLQDDSKEAETIPEPVSVELTDSSLTKEYQEESNLSTVFTDSPPLQANSNDYDDSKLLVLEEKPSEDVDSTSEQVALQDDSKETETIPEPEFVTDSNLDAKQEAEVDYPERTIMDSNEVVSVENSSSEGQINRRTDGEEASSEDPSSSGPLLMKIKKKKFEKSDSSSSSSSSSSDSE